MNLTSYAQRVVCELVSLKHMHFGVIADDNQFNQRLSDADAEKKAAILENLKMQNGGELPPIKIGFWPDPSTENAGYSNFLKRSQAEMVLCRAVDCYHWYLRQVILKILKTSPHLLRPWALQFDIAGERQIVEFETGIASEKLLTKWFRGKEKRARSLVHEHWAIPLKEDLDALVAVRNCIVHQLGDDADGTIATLLSRFPRLQTQVINGSVSVNYAGADAAVEIALGDISIIDQMLANRFGLPTSPSAGHKVTRRYG